MSTLAQIRTAIVAAMNTVPDIGRVHDRERYFREEPKFRALYLYTPAGGEQQLRGWTVRRTATVERDANMVRTINVHTWTIRGYMAFKDEDGSELVFDDLVEQIRAVVRADPTFGDVCQLGPLDDGDNTNGVQVNDAGPVTFCGVLCHSAVLQLRTWSYL
ncbi:hypothetical protein BH10PSE18_BH10PSE18_19040 [soil metagenome]